MSSRILTLALAFYGHSVLMTDLIEPNSVLSISRISFMINVYLWFDKIINQLALDHLYNHKLKYCKSSSQKIQTDKHYEHNKNNSLTYLICYFT